MGDLYSNKGKIVTEDSELNTRLVQILAKKLITHSAVRNVDFRDLCLAELVGENVSSNFRPCVHPTTLKETADGGMAAFIDNELEMELIHNWQNGHFSDEDEKFAAAFRKKSRDIDLTQYKDELKKSTIPFTGNSLIDIYRKVNETSLNARDQWTFLSWYCERLKMPQVIKNLVHRRFRLQSTTFMDFAPYAYYCFLVENVFIWGLANDLIPTSKKAKAHIDIEYVYYFPYVRIFSSNDKLHSELWNVFRDDEQQAFISGNELAEDLRKLELHFQSLSDEEQNKLRNLMPYPPVLENSPTFNAFEKMQRSGVLMPRDKFEGNIAGTRTAEEEKAIVDRVMEMYKYLKGEPASEEVPPDL